MPSDADPPAQPLELVLDAPRTGDVIDGKYRVESVIGRGGMETILAARHLRLGQTVAIKLLGASEVANPESAARFVREARAAVRLQSEHGVRIHDVGQTVDGTPYIVMEHLRGVDLGDYVRAKGPLPVPDALDWILQACEAIAEAHALGIVHRDLKPANLFLTTYPDGSPLVKVLDFGISKSRAPAACDRADAALTGGDRILGSPSYMAPEQIRDPRAADERTDVWALGLVLVELVTGQPAYAAETLPALCAKILDERPPSLRGRTPDVPESLARVLERCLDKAPNRRFQSVAELARALRPLAPARCAASIERILNVSCGGRSTTGVEGPGGDRRMHGSSPSRAEVTSVALSHASASRRGRAALLAGAAAGLLAAVSLGVVMASAPRGDAHGPGRSEGRATPQRAITSAAVARQIGAHERARASERPLAGDAPGHSSSGRAGPPAGRSAPAHASAAPSAVPAQPDPFGDRK